MVSNRFDHSPEPYNDNDSPTAATPSETISSDDLPDDNSNSNNNNNSSNNGATASPAADAPLALLVPWPGATFIIRSVVCGRVITLREGRIELVSPPPPCDADSHQNNLRHNPDVPGMHWDCVDERGWLGFRNKVSGRFLGHDKMDRLCCGAEKQRGWENFVLRVRPQGGAVLYLAHWDRLCCVGVPGGLGVGVGESGEEVLAKMTNGEEEGVVWEFERVGE